MLRFASLKYLVREWWQVGIGA